MGGNESTQPIDYAAIGKAGALLLENETVWMNRRVEAIALGPEPIARRRLSFDFSIPEDPFCATVGAEQRAVCYLPVSVLQKHPPVLNLDLVDESSRPLPLLTTEQNARADTAVLIELARRQLGHEPNRRLRETLETIVWGDRFDSLRALLSIVQPPRSLRLTPAEERARRKLTDSGVFVDLASQLSSTMLLWIPVLVEPGRRRIIKMAYDVPTPNRLNLGQAIWTAFGYAVGTYWVEVPHVGTVASYHLTVSCPSYLEFTDAGMVVEPPAGASEELAPSADVQVQQRLVHFYMTGARATQNGLAWVSLRVERRGFLSTAVLVCAAIGVLLGFFTEWSSQLLVSTRIEPTVTILLAVPAVLVVFLASPAKMLASQRLLIGVRGLVALEGAIAVFSAFAAAAWSASAARDVWLWSAIASGLITIAIAAAVRYPRSGSSWDETI